VLEYSENLSHCTVLELIEIASQIDVGMYKILPIESQDPGIAGLCAFKLLYDELHERSDLSIEVLAFVSFVNTTLEEALKIVALKGIVANIKPKINKLFEYVSGFERQSYEEQRFEEIKKKLIEKDLFSNGRGQLVYRKEDGRFFVLVNQEYIRIPQEIYGGINYPRAKIGHAHFTVNDGMSREKSEILFERYEQEYGLSCDPLYKIPNSDILYLNKTISFSITGAYYGVPKTNSRIKACHQLEIVSQELEELRKNGLYCEYEDYSYHITFAEESREAYKALEEVRSLDEVLRDNDSSNLLKSIIFSSVVIDHRSEGSDQPNKKPSSPRLSEQQRQLTQ
jgi:hypothetical protein